MCSDLDVTAEQLSFTAAQLAVDMGHIDVTAARQSSTSMDVDPCYRGAAIPFRGGSIDIG